MPVDVIRAPWPVAEGAPPTLRLLDPAGGAVLAAVAAPDGDLRLEVAQDGRTRGLWQGPAGGAVQMRRHAGGVMCLVPGMGLIHVPTGGGQAAVLDAEAPPEALLGDGGEVWGVFPAPDSAMLSRLEIGEGGGLTLANRIAAPALAHGQRLSALLRTAEGALVVTADDRERGFHAWIGGAGREWRPLLTAGAARHAMNARVLAALDRGPDLLLAVGPGRDTLARLSGVPVRGELLRVRPDGSFDIVCGELRPSPTGLKVPLATARNPAARALRAAFTHLAPAGEDAIVAQQGQDGGAAFYRVGVDGSLTAEGGAPGLVLDLAPGPEGRPVAVMAGAG